MRINKAELVMIVITAVFIGATAGYLLARAPVAGTFEISTEALAILPSPIISPVAGPVAVVSYEPSYEPTPEPFAEPATEPSAEPTQDNIITEVTATPAPSQTPIQTPEVTPSPTPAPTYTPKPEPDGQVNVNTAGLNELQTLPGVGPVLAQRIIDERESNGAFISAEDLQRVSGIGEKTVEKLKPYVSV